MLELKVLSGRHAGASVSASQLPFVVGRNKEADFRLEEEGVWDRHLQFDLRMPDGFILTASPAALATINGRPIRETPVRNGDLIEIGPVKLRFWLGQTRQLDFRWRECLTWIALAALCAAQLALVYGLSR